MCDVCDQLNTKLSNNKKSQGTQAHNECVLVCLDLCYLTKNFKEGNVIFMYIIDVLILFVITMGKRSDDIVSWFIAMCQVILLNRNSSRLCMCVEL